MKHSRNLEIDLEQELGLFEAKAQQEAEHSMMTQFTIEGYEE